jgi:hypothetical protein
MTIKVKKQFIWIFWCVCFLFSTSLSFSSENNMRLQNELPHPDIPKPQFFCGYCHLLTYPGAVQKGYETWKDSKHAEYGCVQCHYSPPAGSGQTPASGPNKIVKIKKEHIPKTPPERFSYIRLGGTSVKTRPEVGDETCMTAPCHGNPEDDFKTKKIKFTEKVVFTHEPHLEKKNQIEGQSVNCTSCHQHETDKKHFEVSQESCILCHFKNTSFNDGRSKCSLCHVLPEKPIQTSGEKPITHKMLEDAKVQCGGCHFEIIKGEGQISYKLTFKKGKIEEAILIGGGTIKKKACSSCHDKAKDLEALDKKGHKKLMHEKHVTQKNARCFECHRTIRHKKDDVVEPITSDCKMCHPDHHRYQKLLIRGPKREDVFESPDPMLAARANCLSCHMESKKDKKGEPALKATGATCVSCHSKDHDKMLKNWIKEVSEEVKFALELEDETIKKIAKSKGKVSKEKMSQAKKMLKKGQNNLRIVENGNGIHNRKYAMMLLDAAINNFDELIEFLEEEN